MLYLTGVAYLPFGPVPKRAEREARIFAPTGAHAAPIFWRKSTTGAIVRSVDAQKLATSGASIECATSSTRR